MKLKDPYMVKYNDPTVCPECGVVYHKKRWVFDEKLREEYNEKADKKLCPACKKIKDKFAMGFVYIETDYIKDKREEVKNHIRNLEEKELKHNPLDRVMKIEENRDKWTIQTTTEHLAMTIGRSVARTFGGEVKFSFSEDEKMVRVCVYDTNQKEGRT